MSNLGELHCCLGMEFERSREARTTTMHQKSYIEGVLKCFNMEECKTVETRFDTNPNMFKLSDIEFKNVQKEMEGISFIYKARV